MKPYIKDVTMLSNSKFLSMYEIKYTNKIGNEKTWNVASRKNIDEYKKILGKKSENKDAVMIIAHHLDTDKMVLVKQYRVPINDYIYEVPAGLIDEFEDIKVCAKRELKEETGLELVEILKVYENIYISPGMTDENCDIVVCTCKGDISYEFLQEDEDLQICLLNKDELKEIAQSGAKIDIKTMFAIEIFSKMLNLF